jgi:hypothetical protein
MTSSTGMKVLRKDRTGAYGQRGAAEKLGLKTESGGRIKVPPPYSVRGEKMRIRDDLALAPAVSCFCEHFYKEMKSFIYGTSVGEL